MGSYGALTFRFILFNDALAIVDLTAKDNGIVNIIDITCCWIINEKKQINNGSSSSPPSV